MVVFSFFFFSLHPFKMNLKKDSEGFRALIKNMFKSRNWSLKILGKSVKNLGERSILKR